MALFKILRGPSSGLDALPLKDGYCYFAADTGLFYIDYEKDGVLNRIPLNAGNASTLAGATLEHDILRDSETEIPSSALLTKIYDALSEQIAAGGGGSGGSGETIIDQNSKLAFKFWYGSSAEYEAIEDKDEQTIYMLNDLTDGGISAGKIIYDNSLSGLEAETVQDAIDILVEDKQDKVVGQMGQIVGFDENGALIAQPAPVNGVQSDWNTEDEEDLAYIKNKPSIATDEEILDLFFETDMLPVVTDADGSVLTDENNNILLW